MEENYGDTRTVARCRQTRMADAGLYRNRITELLFGYRLLKFWISFTGFLIGGTAGYLIVNQYVNNVAYAILAGFLLGLLIGFLAWRFYLAGVFFMVLIMIFLFFCG